MRGALLEHGEQRDKELASLFMDWRGPSRITRDKAGQRQCKQMTKGFESEPGGGGERDFTTLVIGSIPWIMTVMHELCETG